MRSFLTLPGAALGLLLAFNLGGCDTGSIFGANGLFGGASSAKASSGDVSDGDGEENDDEQDGVDCVDGIDAATGQECDGGPSANQDDGEENDGDGDGECENGVDEHGDPCTDDDTADSDTGETADD